MESHDVDCLHIFVTDLLSVDRRLSLGRSIDGFFESADSLGVNDSHHDDRPKDLEKSFGTLEVMFLNLVVEGRDEPLGGF